MSHTPRCPACDSAVDWSPGTLVADCPSCGTRVGVERDLRTVAPPTGSAEFPPYVGNLDPRSPIEAAADTTEAPRAEFAGYEIIDTIASGGMGVVLRGRQRALTRIVAIKVPLGDALHNPAVRDRFMQEARAVARLQHPNICPIFDVGAARDRPYIVMAFIEGVTLHEWARDTSPNARTVAEVVAKIARAVGFAHSLGIVHRDIKPNNIMMTRSQLEPMLMDFGLAKDLQDQSVHLTQTDLVMGTPAYMSPEQASGRISAVGPATDVYALGAVLFDLICGRPPFLGSIGEVLSQVQTSDPPRPRRFNPRMHRDLETICLKALAKAPTDRYASAIALADDLDRFCAGESIIARPDGVARWGMRFAGRHRVALLAFVLLALGATLASTYFATQVRDGRRAATLAAQIDRRLTTWNSAEAGDTQELIAQLALLSPVQAAGLHARLLSVWSDAIAARMQARSISEADRQSIAGDIAQLNVVDSNRAAALVKLLDARIHLWEQVLQVDCRLPAAKAHFTSPITQDAGGLVFTGAAEKVVINSQVVGNREVSATFSTPDDPRTPFGLSLIDAAGHAYAFSLTEVRDERGQMSFVQRITRGLTVLTSRAEQPQQERSAWRLRARQEGSHLSFQAGEAPPLEFDDIFGLAGSGPIEVMGGTGVRLESIVVARQALPHQPSALENGDALFLTNHLNEALSFYQSESITAKDPATRDEAQYKQALCLEPLNRQAEAETIYIGLQQSGTAPWDVLAAARLWVSYIRQGKAEQADAMLDLLVPQIHLDLLGTMVPEDARDLISRHYAYSLTALSLFSRVTAADVARMGRWIDVARRVGIDPVIRGAAAQGQERGMHLLGDYANAAAVTENWLNDRAAPLDPFAKEILWEDYGWNMRMLGRAQEAVDRMNQQYHLDRDPIEMPGLLIERARLQIALRNAPGALRDVRRFIALTQSDPNVPYRFICNSRLLEGMLLSDAGDQVGAKHAWTAGTLTGEADRFMKTFASSNDLIGATIIGELSEKWTDREAALVLQQIGAIQTSRGPGTGISTLLASGLVSVEPRTLLEMWRTPEGRDLAERIAFRSISMREERDGLIRCGVSTALLDATLDGAASPAQRAAAMALVDNAYATYRRGALTTKQLMFIGSAWSGAPLEFVWQRGCENLDVATRCRLAYFVGLHLIKTGNAAGGRALLDEAQTNAPPDSPEQQLIRAAIASNSSAE
jgi:tRNA A-37 threonylcarbamoyl transferase component Bud32/tetratricopeptide (TPR) repeat protein